MHVRSYQVGQELFRLLGLPHLNASISEVISFISAYRLLLTEVSHATEAAHSSKAGVMER